MSETSRYDFFMDELSSLEKQIYLIAQKCDELTEEKGALEKTIKQLKEENEVLRLQLEETERNITISESDNTDLFGETSLKNEEKEEIKEKITNLINKIDNHLRS